MIASTTIEYERKTIPTVVIESPKIKPSDNEWQENLTEGDKDNLREKLAQEWRDKSKEWSKDRLGHLKSVGNGL